MLLTTLLFLIGLCMLSVKVFKNGFDFTKLCVFIVTAVAWSLLVSIFTSILLVL